MTAANSKALTIPRHGCLVLDPFGVTAVVNPAMDLTSATRSAGSNHQDIVRMAHGGTTAISDTVTQIAPNGSIILDSTGQPAGVLIPTKTAAAPSGGLAVVATRLVPYPTGGIIVVGKIILNVLPGGAVVLGQNGMPIAVAPPPGLPAPGPME